MRWEIVRTGLLGFAAMMAAVLPGGGTTLARLSVGEMARAASAIVRARCEGSETHWEGGEIWTISTFRVDQTWKGSTPSKIRVRLIGGRAGHFISTVADVPRFQPGEEVILFLERGPGGEFSVTSWAQGTFRVRRDARTGREMATQDSVSAVGRGAGAGNWVSVLRRLRVSELQKEVSAALGAQDGDKP